MKNNYITIFWICFLLLALSFIQSQDVFFVPSGDVDGVRVGSFYLSTDVITNQDYFTFIQLDGYRKVSLWDQENLKDLNRFKNQQGDYAPRTWKDSSPPINQEFQAVLGISIAEARAYAKNIGWFIPTARMWKLAQKVKSDIGAYPWKEEESDNTEGIRMMRYAAPAQVWESRLKEIEGALDNLEKTKAKLSQTNMNASLIREQEKKLRSLEQKMKEWEQIPEGLDQKIASGIEKSKSQLQEHIQAIENKNAAFLKSKEESMGNALRDIQSQLQKVSSLEAQFKETLVQEQQKSQKAMEEKMALLEKNISERFSQLYEKKMQALDDKEKAMDKKLLAIEGLAQNIQNLTQDMGKIKEETKAMKEDLSQLQKLPGDWEKQQKELQEKHVVPMNSRLKTLESQMPLVETKIQECVGNLQKLNVLCPATSDNISYAQMIQGLRDRQNAHSQEISNTKEKNVAMEKSLGILKDKAFQMETRLNEVSSLGEDLKTNIASLKQADSNLNGEVQNLKQQQVLLTKEDSLLKEQIQNVLKKTEKQEKDITQILQQTTQLESKAKEFESKVQELKKTDIEQAKKNTNLELANENAKEKFLYQEKNIQKLEEELKALKLADIEYSKRMLAVNASLESMKQRSDELMESIKSLDQKCQENLLKFKNETENASRQMAKTWEEDVKNLKLVDVEHSKKSLTLQASLDSVKQKSEEIQETIINFEKKMKDSLGSLKAEAETARKALHKSIQEDMEKLAEKNTQNQTALVSIKQETANRSLNLDNSVNSLKSRVQNLETSQLDTVRQISLSASEMRRGMMEVGEKIHKLFQSELLFGPLPTKDGEVVKPKEKDEEKKAPEIPIEKIVEEIKAKILKDAMEQIVKKAQERSEEILKQVDANSHKILRQSLGEFCYELGKRYYEYSQPELTYTCMQMANQFWPEHEKAQTFLKENASVLHCPKEMVYIPGDKVNLGSEKDPEFPLQEANIGDFYLDKYEVTRKDFAVFIQSGGYKLDEFWSEEGRKWRDWRTQPSGWQLPSPEEENFPMTNITYYEAEAYSKWAGKRLPTAQEWEYAARGKEGKIFPWGEEPAQSGKLFFTNFRQISEPKDGYEEAAPVNAFMKDMSPFGIVGMAGNVSEWCQGVYTVPGSNRKLNVVKGGSFQHLWFRLQLFTSLGRRGSEPFQYIGFRCAKDVPVQK